MIKRPKKEKIIKAYEKPIIFHLPASLRQRVNPRWLAFLYALFLGGK